MASSAFSPRAGSARLTSLLSGCHQTRRRCHQPPWCTSGAHCGAQVVHVVVHIVVHGSGVVGRGKCHCQRTQLVTIFITIILIIITTRPKPAYGRQGLASVLLRIVGAQLGINKNVTDIHTLHHNIYINIINLYSVPKLDCQKRLNFENVNFEKQYHRNKCISITVLLVLHFSLLNGDNNTKEAFSRVD